MLQQHFYNIHEITSVMSEAPLPELASFRVDALAGTPNIRVRLGKPSAGALDSGAADQRYIRYDEGLGAIGFSTEICIHDRNNIDVVANPILQHSPHVLYTNIVEPILRWNFVEKGCALVHGACIAYGDDAYMVTARTDTGKTTTILRILDEYNTSDNEFSFISDDLTLVTPDGIVRTYPKPLTISSHTVAAVKTPRLSRRERMTLPLQSRIHSRRGRRLALFLAKTKLPMATVNTITQWLVPPPKYHVERLVPGVEVTNQAHLRGLFVIERGGTGERQLDNQEAMEILLSNCDDAYGFPPYDTLENFLRTVNGADLRDVERDIVTEAFNGKQATLLRSTTLDWAQRIPAFMDLTKRSLTPAAQPALEARV